MATGKYRRRSTSNRAEMMPSSQLHAVAGHLMKLLEDRDLTVGQDKFLSVIIVELEHRRERAHWTERCRCRLCVPAAPIAQK